MPDSKSRDFRNALLGWFASSRRDLPWRRDGDFYRVWLSEIMLQQTRVQAVIPYYERFLERFPTIEALASAPEQDVLAAWSGLGYYSRARNLQKGAKDIAERGMPATHAEIGGISGIGPYTSAAIASIVLGLPHAAVDGNVLRVIARLTNDGSEISSPATRRRFAHAAQELLDPANPGDFNQAMMELGATVCKPGAPLCGECPVRRFCDARAAGTERELPVKRPKLKTRDVPLDLVVLLRKGAPEQVCLMQRAARESRLAGFWELPERSRVSGVGGRPAREFTHHIVNDRFRVRVWLREATEVPEGCQWTDARQLGTWPVSTITRKALAAAGEPKSS
jgi:A/G-specific adenine glycosylase